MPFRLSGLLLITLPAAMAAQAPTPDPMPSARRVTVTAGSGNAMGWLGAQAERYFAGEHRSVFLGLGYTPDLDGGDTSGLAAAAGVRGYTGGVRHRGFLELSVSQIVVSSLGSHHYGPGVQLGYQYAARRGFTAAASLGLGYVLSRPAAIAGSRLQPIGGIGFGYTWR